MVDVAHANHHAPTQHLNRQINIVKTIGHSWREPQGSGKREQ